MRIGPSLILASRQTLAMTPQLQQAIKLLQFSHLELAAFVQQELEKNLLIQETQPDDGPHAEPALGPTVEPVLLCARTVAYCRRTQPPPRYRREPAMKALLEHLDLVAAGELNQLRRRCGVDEEDLRDMLAELRTLDPRPGQKFDFEPIQP